MKNINNKEEFKKKLDEIAQRMCGVDYDNLAGFVAPMACILEATGVITADEHEVIKQTLS